LSAEQNSSNENDVTKAPDKIVQLAAKYQHGPGNGDRRKSDR